MYNLYTEPQCNNTRCPYYNICDQVPAITKQSEYREQYSPVDFLFLTEYPTWREARYRTLWAASVGQVVREALEQTCPDATYTVTSAVRAWPYQGSSLPSWGMQYNGYRPSMIPDSILQKTKTWPVHTHPQYHEIVQNCRQFWERDIQVWQPRQIVVMGNIALETMFPNMGKSLLDLADTIGNYRGIPTRFITSPHFILQKPALKNTWTKNFRRVLLNQKQAHFDYNPEAILLDTVEGVREAIREMRASGKPICIDTETANLNKRHGAVLGMIQLATDANKIYAIPWIHYETPFTPDQLEELRVILQDLFLDYSVPYWITYNGKFEINILENAVGCGLNAKIFDAQCAEFLLDENRADRRTEFKYGTYSLKQVALDRLGYDGWNQDVLASRGEGSLMDLPLRKIADYGCTDVGLTMLVHEDQIRESELQQYDKFFSLVFGLYNAIMKVFSQVERDGFPASLPYLRTLIQRNSPLLTKLRELQEEVIATPEGKKANKIILDRSTKDAKGFGVVPLARTPTVFDFAKTGHPQVLFFDVLGLKPTKYAEGGTPSVDDEFQEAYKATIPLVAKFSEWIEIKKMFDSFAKQLYDYLDPAGPHSDCKTDQRIRPSFQVSKVITGRIACSGPNLQAIPRADSGVKKMIKNIFQVNQKGRVLVQLDFKANEMRWVGIAAKDHAMAKKFLMGKEALDRYRKTLDPEDYKLATLYGDIHKQNASSAFKQPIDEITKNQRQAAKGISFGVLYDSQEKSVAELYGLDLQETINMFQGFYEVHHAIYGWKMEMKEMARQRGFVEAPHGRRRRFPIFDLYRDASGWFDQNAVPREHQGLIADALRQASNAPIQGIASDAANIGAENLRNYIKRNRKDWKFCNVVHDSCIVDIPYQDIDEYIEVAEPIFTTEVMDYMNDLWDIDFILPLEVDFDIGTKWGDLIGWDFSPTGLKDIKDKMANLVT